MSVSRLAEFVVPSGDIAWCAALAEALSICCASPSRRRVAEVRALVASMPVQMVPMPWHDLVALARDWLPDVGIDAGPFRGRAAIEAALRDKPCAVPSWAEHYR